MDEDGELVKYMSNLPSYLERGLNFPEKAFNIGVLDWGNLEKWQVNQKFKLQRPRGPSATCSDLSSSLLTDELSSNSTYLRHASVHEEVHGRQSRTVSSDDLHGVKSLGLNKKHKTQEIEEALEDRGESEGDVRRRKWLDSSIKKLQESNNGRVSVPFTGHVPNDVSGKSACSINISSTKLEETGWRSFFEKPRDSGVSFNMPQSYILPWIPYSHEQLRVKLKGSHDSGPSCSSSRPIAEAAPASQFPETSTRQDMGTCQSGPPQRMLDPVLKVEEKLSLQRIKPLPATFSSGDRVCKPTNSHIIWSSRLKCCRTVDVRESQSGKNGMSVAFLQVAFKNGHPLFTFSLNNGKSDILAASVKNSSKSRKRCFKWSYKILRIPAVKREMANKMKVGQVGAHHYCPTVVSQLNISEFDCSRSNRQREFVLFPVKRRKDELAAIVVQIPSTATRNATLNGYHCQPHQFGSEGHSPNIRSCPKGGENMQDQLLFGNKNLITVILPNGAHSLPSEGEPSSLIERWTSGGSCDCGGWDLDCKLRILVNQNHVYNELRSSKAYTSSYHKLAAFTQVHDQDKQPVLSLSKARNGSYNVEFDTSISELQAFSICIALLESGCPSQPQTLGKGLAIETPKSEN